MAWGFLCFSVVLTALSQVMYKLYFAYKNRFLLLLTVLSFACIPLSTTMALRSISLDVVYMFTAISIALVVVASRLLFGEKQSLKSYLYVFLIILGVIVYNL